MDRVLTFQLFWAKDAWRWSFYGAQKLKAIMKATVPESKTTHMFFKFIIYLVVSDGVNSDRWNLESRDSQRQD